MLKTAILATLLLAQTPAKLAFDVATVKPSDTSMGIGTFFTRPGGRIDASGCTLQLLIQYAYGVDAYQVLGGPSWVKTNYFAITAVPPPDSEAAKYIPKDQKTRPPADELEMLRTLLAERFQLKVHEEVREGPMLELVRGDKPFTPVPTADPEHRPMISYPQIRKPDRNSGMQGHNATMQIFADAIASTLRQRVVDKTGLTGSFDFRLEYWGGMQDDAAGPSLPTALQEQLGLKLQSGRGPTRYIVIDQVSPLAQ